MKIVGIVDVPAAAADFINTGGQLYHSTHDMRRVGLSGFRPLKERLMKTEILQTVQHWTNSSVKKEDSLNQILLSMTRPRNVIVKQIVVLITFQSLQELS